MRSKKIVHMLKQHNSDPTALVGLDDAAGNELNGEDLARLQELHADSEVRPPRLRSCTRALHARGS